MIKKIKKSKNVNDSDISPKSLQLENSSFKLYTGCILTSLGILITSSGGSWDITNHLLNKPETFFSIPHLALYSGVVITAVGFSLMLFGNRGLPVPLKFILPMRLVLIGLPMVILAGPFDYTWHLAFGFDGLLSPSHFTLTFGLFLTSIGSLLGMVQFKNRINLFSGGSSEKKELIANKTLLLINHKTFWILGVLPVWLITTGLFYMFSLPFSNTEFFNFNPDPTFAAIFATISYPLLVSTILYLSFGLGKKFGLLTITGICFIFVNTLTSILPNEFLITTIPFYLLGIIPIVVSDVIFSYSKRRSVLYLGGAILGSSSFLIYFPLITYVYNGVFTKTAVFPSYIPNVFSDLLFFAYPILVGGLIASGILGIILGQKILFQMEKTKKTSLRIKY